MQAHLPFLRIIGTLVIGLFLNSCNDDFWSKCTQSAGQDDSKIVYLEKFTQLDVQDRFIIHLIQDTSLYVELKGKSNLIDHTNLSVENNTLTIADENKCKFLKGYHLTDIYLHFDTLEQINIIGNSEFYSEDTLVFQRILIESKADMTRIDLKVKANRILVKMHAVVGEMKISGISNYAYYYCSGSNHLLFKDLICKQVYVNHTGLGSVYTTALEEFSTTVNNRGSVHCYGNPSLKNESYGPNGSGQIYYPE